MKVQNLFIMSLAALSMVACSNDEEVIIPQNGSVVVKLATAEPKTRAETTVGYDQENAMNTGFLYAFSGSTLVETKEFSTASNSIIFDKLTVDTEYTFVAVANSDEKAPTAEGFKTIEIAAPAEKANFVMYEVATASPTAEGVNVNIVVKRVLSAVQLNTVIRNQGTGVPSTYSNADMEIVSLTLSNVNPSVNLNGDKIVGTSVIATDLAASFSNVILGKGENTTISGGTVGERAYACPTAASGTLYAVLEVNYKGVKTDGSDETKYFNIVLDKDKGLDANTLYVLNVTITGVGSDNPGDPDSFGSATGIVTPAPWSNGSVINAGNQGN